MAFPSGTFSADAYCTIDPGDSNDVPSGTSGAIGPYAIDCSDVNGNVLNSPQQPLTVSVKVPNSNYQAYTSSNDTWSKQTSSNSSGKLQFKLTSTKLFAAAQAKKSSKLGLVVNILLAFLVILILFGIVSFIVWKRRQQEVNTGGY